MFSRKGDWPTPGHDEVNLEPHELGREGGEALEPPLRISVRNDDVLSLDPAALAQRLPEGFPVAGDLRGDGRGIRENTYPSDLPRLLGVGGKRRGEEGESEGG